MYCTRILYVEGGNGGGVGVHGGSRRGAIPSLSGIAEGGAPDCAEGSEEKRKAGRKRGVCWGFRWDSEAVGEAGTKRVFINYTSVGCVFSFFFFLKQLPLRTQVQN